MQLNEIALQFDIPAVPRTITPYGEGHINDTYLVETSAGRYILQKINKNVFKFPEEIMLNISKITKHLNRKITADSGDPLRETLNIVPTLDGKSYFLASDGEYYRVYLFIENAVTHQAIRRPSDFYEAAEAFAQFQKRLADFPADELFDPIKNFHNTGIRFENLKNAIKSDIADCVKRAGSEIDFALQRSENVNVFIDALKSGEIPLRVTHNDTKLNNVLFDKLTGKALCVIDLDTVMPGTLLFDFGDAIRFGASTAAEDELDLDKVNFSKTLFEHFTDGFCGVLKNTITKTEAGFLPLSAKIITLEIGVRFLTDYLEGNVYFKTAYPEHNLVRARTQFKLVSCMEQSMDFMHSVVNRVMGY